MADCCNDKACEIEALHNRRRSTLKIVPGINALMFAVELAAGVLRSGRRFFKSLFRAFRSWTYSEVP